jgi:hypothetical protein
MPNSLIFFLSFYAAVALRLAWRQTPSEKRLRAIANSLDLDRTIRFREAERVLDIVMPVYWPFRWQMCISRSI